jgi:hypothetical protein
MATITIIGPFSIGVEKEGEEEEEEAMPND